MVAEDAVHITLDQACLADANVSDNKNFEEMLLPNIRNWQKERKALHKQLTFEFGAACGEKSRKNKQSKREHMCKQRDESTNHCVVEENEDRKVRFSSISNMETPGYQATSVMTRLQCQKTATSAKGDTTKRRKRLSHHKFLLRPSKNNTQTSQKKQKKQVNSRKSCT